jgi:hypothetical protein
MDVPPAIVWIEPPSGLIAIAPMLRDAQPVQSMIVRPDLARAPPASPLG